MAGRGAAAGLTLVALSLIAAGCGGGGTTTVTVTRTRTVTTTRTVTKTTPATAAACTGSQLSGTFALVPGSAGAGHIAYVLTLQNASQTRCSVSGTPTKMVLLGSSGATLPTHVVAVYGAGGSEVVLAPGASAKAQARFSPDVPGTGDKQSGACQPKAYTLRVTLEGGGTTDAPVQPPTSVCEQGQLQFEPFSGG